MKIDEGEIILDIFDGYLITKLTGATTFITSLFIF